MSNPSGMVITRFAPSPSGHLHIGGARTALFCWAWARRNDEANGGAGGRFIVRMEDTDQARSSEASARAILEDLAWLGIDWDEGPEMEVGRGSHGSGEACHLGGDPRGVGPWRQSERLDMYNEWIERLVAEGKAYPAFEAPEELEEKRKAAIAEKHQYRYDRAALQLTEAERVERMRRGDAHVIRIKTPDEAVRVHDEVLGDVSFGAGELDDFIIRKRDGYPTYHFAVVVDDAQMGVTHILRGQEHLNNTPRHVVLQRAMGFPTPVYAHMPLIFNEKGAKMSKRERDVAAKEAVREAVEGGLVDSVAKVEAIVGGRARLEEWLGDKKAQLESGEVDEIGRDLGLTLPEVSVHDFRKAGYLPEVITNFLGLLGWTPSKNADGSDREKFDMAFLARDFDIARIGKTNARFDRVKLASFNQDAIAGMEDGEFARRWRAWAEEFRPFVLEALGERWEMACRAAKPRCKVLGDLGDVVAFAVVDDAAVVFDEKAVGKVLLKGDPNGLEVLREIRGTLEGIESWDPAAIEASVASFCEGKGIGMGKAAQPLRVAVTGGTVSPGLGETLALVGREGTLRRIERCVRECASHSAAE